MLKVALALIGEWRIAVPATGGLAGEQLFEHGEPPKRKSFASQSRKLCCGKKADHCDSPARTPRAKHKSPRNITAVAVAARMVRAILLPQQHKRHAASLELFVQFGPIGRRALRLDLARGREQPALKLAVIEYFRQRPGQPDHLGAAHNLTSRGLADPKRLADLPVAQSKRVPKTKHLAHLAHRQSLRWHR